MSKRHRPGDISHFFLTVLEARNLRAGCQQGGVSSDASPLGL